MVYGVLLIFTTTDVAPESFVAMRMLRTDRSDLVLRNTGLSVMLPSSHAKLLNDILSPEKASLWLLLRSGIKSEVHLPIRARDLDVGYQDSETLLVFAADFFPSCNPQKFTFGDFKKAECKSGDLGPFVRSFRNRRP